MLFDPVRISDIIRRKKKAAMEAEPELVDTDSKVDVNPMDAMNLQMDADLKHTLDVPERRDAREHQPEGEEADNMGLTAEEKTRMARLRKMFEGTEL
jgi:hypothetical protein